MMSIFLILVAGLAVSVNAIDITVTETNINGVEVFPNHYISLDLEKGGELEVEIEFTSQEDLDDVEIRATILSSEDDIEEILPLFDTREDTEYKKTLRLQLPMRLDEDEYRLMVIISDRHSEELSHTYNIFVNSRRHLLAVEDVLLHPFGRVTAGEFILAKVRLENFGQKDEEDIRVVVSIPELDVKALSYINEVEFDDQAETEEMLLVIPECAEAKQYDLDVLVEYNSGRDTLTEQRSVFVRANPDCKVDGDVDAEPAVVVIIQNEGDATGAATADLTEANADEPTSLRKALEVALLVLVVLLVIIGLVIGFMKLKGDE